MYKINMYWKNKTVLVTGAHGFVGHSVMKLLKLRGCSKIIAPTKSDYDLRKEEQVESLFSSTKPDVVLHLAGKIGGINANRKSPGEFFYDNLMIGTLVLDQARRASVSKLVALAAGCGYPKFLEVPYTEKDFWNKLPDENSIGYSMAKKMLIIQSWTYREQYGFDSSILLPANLYGPHDNFHLENCHVVPALIKKFVDAKENGTSSVTVWGTGSASREFLYVDDTAEAILDVAEKYNNSGPLNLGTGVSTPIKELANTISNLVDFSGNIIWDKSMPDGQPERYYDMSLFKKEIGYVPSTSLKKGLKKTIEWYITNKDNVIEK